MAEGLLNYADAGEARKIMTYALPDGRLTWNVAVAWPEAEVQPRLGVSVRSLPTSCRKVSAMFQG